MFHDPRKVVLRPQQDEGEALVVAQQDVERRAKALDQLSLEQQRLGFRIGDDDFHRAALADHALQAVGQLLHLRVIRDACLQAAGLAHVKDVAPCIEHAVNAGAWLQRLDRLSDGSDASLEIGLRAGDGIGCPLLVEAFGSSGIVGSACGGARHERQIGGSTRRLNHLRYRRIWIFPEKDGHGPTLRNT